MLFNLLYTDAGNIFEINLYSFSIRVALFTEFENHRTKELVAVIDLNLSLYSPYYAETCNEFAGPISALLCPDNTALFEEMLQRWQAVGNTVSDLTGLRFEPQTSRCRAFLLDLQADCGNLTAKLDALYDYRRRHFQGNS